MPETKEHTAIQTSIDRPFDWVAALAMAVGAVVTVTSVGAFIVTLVTIFIRVL